MHTTTPDTPTEPSRRNRPPEGLFRPRPPSPRFRLGRLLLALEGEPCDCLKGRRRKLKRALRAARKAGPATDAETLDRLRAAFESVGPPCDHVLDSDHRVPLKAWARLMAAWDRRGQREPRKPRTPMTREEWEGYEPGQPSLRIDVYAARAARGEALYHPDDNPGLTEADAKARLRRMLAEMEAEAAEAGRDATLKEARARGAAVRAGWAWRGEGETA